VVVDFFFFFFAFFGFFGVVVVVVVAAVVGLVVAGVVGLAVVGLAVVGLADVGLAVVGAVVAAGVVATVDSDEMGVEPPHADRARESNPTTTTDPINTGCRSAIDSPLRRPARSAASRGYQRIGG
jgi:hypothetical protein